MFSLGLPNLITLSRIVAIPAISYCYLRGFYGWALGLLFYAGFSDVVDGALARVLSRRTKLGAILDPAADKLLMTVLFVTLSVRGQIPWWLTGMIIARDIYIVTGVFLLRVVVKKIYIRPTPISKLTTFFQLALLFFCLSRSYLMEGPAFFAQFFPIVVTLFQGTLYLVAAITVASGVHYTLVGWAIYRNRANDLFFEEKTETGGERFSSGGGENPP